jgi:hypothetical protein
MNVPDDTDLAPLAGMRNLTITMTQGQHVRSIEKLHRSARIEWQQDD